MKTPFILIFTLSLFSLLGYSQAVQSWKASFNGASNSNDGGISTYTDAAGNVYSVGYTAVDNRYDCIVIKYDVNGVQQWFRTYNNSNNIDAAGRGISGDANGNIIVTGNVMGTDAYDSFTIKYDSSGNQLWVQTYNGVKNGEENSYIVKVDNSGNIFIGGYANLNYSPGGDFQNRDFLVIKYNSDGAEQWVQTYNRFGGANNDNVYDLVLDDESNVYVTGYSATLLNAGNAEGDDYATVKYNTYGEQQWVALYHNESLPEEYGEAPRSIALDSEGNVIVTGWAASTANGDALTIKYGPDGTTIWEKRYHGTGTGAEPKYLGVDSLDNIYIAGTRSNYDFVNDIGRNDFFAVKYDPSGNEIWVQTYAENATTSNSEAIAAKLDPKGNLYVTGYNDESGDFMNLNFMTVKFSSSGITEWVMIYDGLGQLNDLPSDLELDKAGNVYITGAEVNDAVNYTYDILTMKYSQMFNGTHTWEKGKENELTIYPNPAIDRIKIQGNEKILSVECKNYAGQTVSVTFANNTVDISDLPGGIYILNVVTGKGNSFSKSFIKE